MIAQLSGTLLEATPTQAVVDAGGVGFELGISGTTAAALPAPGGAVSLYTRFRLANDAMALYGFATREERTMFDRLIAVSSVGPRMALSVLSRFTVGELYAVVMAEDAKAMATVPGVGKKTAQRLILELKGTLAKDASLAGAAVPVAGQLPLSAAGADVLGDARAALLSMGFSPQEAELALDGYDGQSMRVEELLGAALKRLGMEA
ncbi:Holliday junction branch migration protein RuvA [Collinsella intestinalis]|uniref:Holliday junction branch migration protein RuvA n=1 Tax=Collinsella intestinalis TaxID=147207 RepID=UPI0019582C68|nr:Holliday junction branch migration protein RuvA [Collinsella intestinalis]MBM6908764.1 Holliday junction branch migration protein RuvA [Collinsella intestinalis]MDM8163127.1 Holliday junction branch migration protein RuvA [Collinsella intestinalis]HIU05961.1 Holliday junction branch migration protein RuvA [Candidatus Coprousia avicola]